MLNSIIAVIAGYAAMVVAVMIGTVIAVSAFMPGGMQAMKNPPSGQGVPPRYLIANITASLLAAILGGWVTARIAAAHPRRHLLALCLLVAVMGLVAARQGGGGSRPGQPSWYAWGIVVIGVIGVLIGGVVLAAP